ncbi:hypothetical protein DID78_01055 [Candidatus Marinamargulisbacteria bacterium SCGC AG-343-D04]|nr:hypothetical protein DID78_01055 [Candidatus Marinamargulisbacteria bacterium SCGC AG-343-D04]
MEIEKKKIKNTEVVRINFGKEISPESKELTGTIELDIENQLEFVDYINTLLDENSYSIIIDMGNISYIDSSGLWALFESHKKAEQRSGKLILINPKNDVKRVLDITKMSTKITILENEEQAIQHFK